MPEKQFVFGDFTLDPVNRRLTRGPDPVPVSGRYFDALCLLVSEAGHLISKDRFMDEVWKGAAVTDEALTQAIRTLRKELGDRAGNPRYIETVPGHGYRFVAEVEMRAGAAGRAAQAPPARSTAWSALVPVTVGGALAGLLGGAIYGSILSAGTDAATGGAISTLLVVAALCACVGLLAGLGVGGGLAAARLFPGPPILRHVAGGALGGFLVGTVTKLIGADALTLLFGVGLQGMTGGGEGLVLGSAAGLSFHLAREAHSTRAAVISLGIAVMAGLGAGLSIHALGGKLMAGSLALLLETAVASRLDLAALGSLTGEAGFGPVSRMVTTACEAALFTGLIAICVRLLRRSNEGL